MKPYLPGSIWILKQHKSALINCAQVHSSASPYSFFTAECLCWALCKRCGNLEMNLPLSSVMHLLPDHTNRETQEHKYTDTHTSSRSANRHTVSVCSELWTTGPLSCFLLFFTLWSSCELEFIWSYNQKIKSAKPSVGLGHSVSVSIIYSQDKLKETAEHFPPPKKHKTLFDSSSVHILYVCQHQHSSFFYVWPYPWPKSFPAPKLCASQCWKGYLHYVVHGIWNKLFPCAPPNTDVLLTLFNIKYLSSKERG